MELDASYTLQLVEAIKTSIEEIEEKTEDTTQLEEVLGYVSFKDKVAEIRFVICTDKHDWIMNERERLDMIKNGELISIDMREQALK